MLIFPASIYLSGMIKVFLRLALALSFLSAVADRLGLWPAAVSVWGSWPAFLEYTALINPWMPVALVGFAGAFVTVAEVALGVLLLLGFRTRWAALASAALLLLFGLAMTFSTGLKGALDYSVFTAAAAAFALANMEGNAFELDRWIAGRK